MKLEIKIIIDNVEEWGEFSDPNSDHKEVFEEIRFELHDCLDFVDEGKSKIEVNIIE